LIGLASVCYQRPGTELNTWICAADHTDQRGAHTATSRHPGVVNVLYADGGVRSVKGTVSRKVWRALGTKAGGEVISESDYGTAPTDPDPLATRTRLRS
jgi:prepilin-type processing-associated H-X9-DG protein